MRLLMLLLLLPTIALAEPFKTSKIVSESVFVYYGNNKHGIDSNTVQMLKEMDTTGKSIYVIGRTSSPASETYNQRLGLLRAKGVAKVLGTDNYVSEGELKATDDDELSRHVEIQLSQEVTQYNPIFQGGAGLLGPLAHLAYYANARR